MPETTEVQNPAKAEGIAPKASGLCLYRLANLPPSAASFSSSGAGSQ